MKSEEVYLARNRDLLKDDLDNLVIWNDDGLHTVFNKENAIRYVFRDFKKGDFIARILLSKGVPVVRSIEELNLNPKPPRKFKTMDEWIAHMMGKDAESLKSETKDPT